MRVGVAQTEELEYLAIKVGDYQLVSLSGKIFFSSMNLHYQQRVKDWLALYVDLDFTARIGVEFSTLFAEGVNTVNHFNVGWLIRLWHTEKHLLSSYFNLSNYNASFVNLKNAFEGLKNDTLIAVSEKVPALIGALGMRYYYVPSDLLGIGAIAELDYGESLRRGEQTIFYILGAKVDLDLYGRTNIPLGFALHYYVSSNPSFIQVENDEAQILGFRIAYTGGNDFMIGFGGSMGLLPVESKDNPIRAYFGNIELNYYFR